MNKLRQTLASISVLAILLSLVSVADAQVAVRGETVYTMSGDPITDGIVLIRDGKITAVGKAADVKIPEGIWSRCRYPKRMSRRCRSVVLATAT